jgi:hypothetical protein
VTGAELLDYGYTNLMALVDFAASNSIALLSLLVAVFVWRQSRADAKLAKATAVMNVKPYLSIATDRDPPRYIATLENNGLGPAIIDSFDVYLDGDLVIDDDNHNSVEVAAQKVDLKIATQCCVSFASGYAFKASNEIEFFEIVLNENNPPTSDHIKAELARIDIVIGYSDIFGNVQKPYDTRGKPRF